MDTINISCFGAIRPLKNHLIQAMAAIEFANLTGKKLRFHVNATRKEQGGEPILRNLVRLFEDSGHELVMVEWLEHPAFLKYIRDNIDIGMQVSFTETFNIVAADHVISDVPVLTSKEVPFTHWLFQADPTCFRTMVRKLLWINRTRWLRLEWLNYRLLEDYNLETIRVWRTALDHL